MAAVTLAMFLMLLLAQSQIVEIEKGFRDRSLQDSPVEFLDSLKYLSINDMAQNDKVSLNYNMSSYLTIPLSIFTCYCFPSYPNCHDLKNLLPTIFK
jgi:hypothetical protein